MMSVPGGIFLGRICDANRNCNSLGKSENEGNTANDLQIWYESMHAWKILYIAISLSSSRIPECDNAMKSFKEGKL